MDFEKKIEESLGILKNEGFDVVFNSRKQILFIDKHDISIYCVKNLMKFSKNKDSESFDISDSHFYSNYKTIKDSINYSIKFHCKSRYVNFDLSNYVKDYMIDKVISSLDFLVMAHVNSYCTYKLLNENKNFKTQI